MNQTFKILLILFFSILLLFQNAESRQHSRTFYIDYNNGSDLNRGKSKYKPFKHCPFDPAATGYARSLFVQPGDRFIFKGDVVYRGIITIKKSGTKYRPILLDGNSKGTFGSGKAIIDGSDKINGFRRCRSYNQCKNKNWKKIYYAKIPFGITAITANIHEKNKMLTLAQYPPPKDPFYYDNRHEFRKVPVKDYSSTQIKDSRYFIQNNHRYWHNSYVIVWTGNNRVITRKIKRFVPGQHLIQFKSTLKYLRIRRDRYALLNHISFMTQPGTYFVNMKQRTLYIWPYSSSALRNNISISKRKVAFLLNGKNYITIKNFKIRRFSGDIHERNKGAALINYAYRPAHGLQFLNNEVYQCKSASGYWVIHAAGCNNSIIKGNYVHHNQIARAIAFTGSKRRYVFNNIISNNIIYRNGGSGITFYFVQNSRIIENKVKDNWGHHANGIAVYLNSNNILISRNKVYNSNMAIAIQRSSNITITNNLLLGRSTHSRVLNLYGRGRNISVLHNTVLNSKKNQGIFIPRDAKGYVIKNNITDGITITNKHADFKLSHNIYVGLTWNMKPYMIGKHSEIIYDLKKLFVNPQKFDFRLKRNSPAVNKGVHVKQKVIVDIDNTKRPKNGKYDIGAYESH